MGPAIWLAMARDDLRAAELLGEHGMAPFSCLHADHAVEKALRAFHLHREGGVRCSVFGYPRSGWIGSEHRTPNTEYPTSDTQHRLGPQRRGLAAALASLSLHSTGRQPAERSDSLDGPDAEAAFAREAVQVAQELIERVTERVYAGVRR